MTGQRKQSDDTRLGATIQPLALDVRQMAAALSISERSVWKLSASGDLSDPVRLGRCRRWIVRDVEAALAAKRDGPPDGGE